jgi:hypothetical protein
VSGGTALIDVPWWETESARLKIVRSEPYSTSSSGLFLIAPDLVSPWWSEIADSEGVGWYTSLALGPDGTPHISYSSSSTTLKYAHRSDSGWAVDTVATHAFNETGQYGSIAVDSQGRPHIVYHDYPGIVYYTYKDAGVWTTSEIVDSGYGFGAGTSIELDAAGNPHVGYVDGGDEELRYAYKNGGGWTPEIVDDVGSVGWEPSLALDEDGYPHISYYDWTNSSLKYAYKDGGGWQIETVAAASNAGWYSSLAIDAEGRPHISYHDDIAHSLCYAYKDGGGWQAMTVDAAGDVGSHSSLALDEEGIPHISYYDNTNDDLKHAYKRGTSCWVVETVDAAGNVGRYNSLALDAEGRPHTAYNDPSNFDIKYACTVFEVIEPSAGVTWPVGAERTITWSGAGSVDLWLSVDGGVQYDLLATDLADGSYGLTVPHTPSRFCRVRLERAVPWSVAVSDSFFTIETSISLLAMSISQAPEGGTGVVISWETDPGPDDLAGYRLERGEGVSSWLTLVSLTRETSYLDREAPAGARYRLFAVNGLGEELFLGETSLRPSAALAAWPLPYLGGRLTISFATASALGGGAAPAELALYDAAGRLVRVVDRGLYPAGTQTVTWDGLDDQGRRVPAGVYFLRSESAGQHRSLKVLVIR